MTSTVPLNTKVQFNYFKYPFTECIMSREYEDFLYILIYAYCLDETVSRVHFESQMHQLSLENIKFFLEWHGSRSLSSSPMEIDKLDSMVKKNNLFVFTTKLGFYSTKNYYHLLFPSAPPLNLLGLTFPIYSVWVRVRK